MNKSFIRRRMGEYLLYRGINISKPFRCLNPEHPDKNPSMSFDKKRNKVHCFSCGADYDIFDLIGMDYSLTEAKDIFAQAEIMFGSSPETADEKICAPEDEKNRNFFLKGENALLKSEEARKYLESRGVSAEVARLFHVGYSDGWRSPKAVSEGKNPPPTARIIIPTGGDSYIARDISPDGDERFRTMKEGPARIFNADALYRNEPVFVVEGEFDALGILSCGKSALALGGIGNSGKFLETCAKNKPSAPLILSLDNDGAGARAQRDIASALMKYGIPFEERNISGAYKDPNEHLQMSPASFRAALESGGGFAAPLGGGAHEQLELLLADIEKSKSEPAVTTGFSRLDEAINGGLSPSLIILGAISSLGKTAYVMQIADQAARSGTDVIVFTVEMSSKELISRSLSRITQESSLSAVNKRRTAAMTAAGVMTGSRYTRYSEQEKGSISDAVDIYRREYAPRLRFVEEREGETISCRRIRGDVHMHISATGRKPVVIIDYIQLLESDDIRGSDKQNVDRNVKQLKQISRDFGIPIIAVSSLNRQNYNAPVNMEAFKESGSLEYSADILIGMQLRGVGEGGFNMNAAKAADPRAVDLVVLKNRAGIAGTVIPYRYYAKYNLFIEEDQSASQVNRAGKRKT